MLEIPHSRDYNDQSHVSPDEIPLDELTRISCELFHLKVPPYLCGAPSDTEREDNLTQQFVKWLKEQPQLKAILTGHLHEFWQEQFSPTAVQYVVGGAFRGDAYHIKFV